MTQLIAVLDNQELAAAIERLEKYPELRVVWPSGWARGLRTSSS
jgi:hypothetical protein